jgi:hypothetical protein
MPKSLPVRLVDESGREVGTLTVPLRRGDLVGRRGRPDDADWALAVAIADFWLSTTTRWQVVDYADAQTIIVVPGDEQPGTRPKPAAGPVPVFVPA